MEYNKDIIKKIIINHFKDHFKEKVDLSIISIDDDFPNMGDPRINGLIYITFKMLSCKHFFDYYDNQMDENTKFYRYISKDDYNHEVQKAREEKINSVL